MLIRPITWSKRSNSERIWTDRFLHFFDIRSSLGAKMREVIAVGGARYDLPLMAVGVLVWRGFREL